MEQDKLGRVKIVAVSIIVLIGLLVGWAYYFSTKNAPPAAVVEEVKNVVPVNSIKGSVDEALVNADPSLWLVKKDSVNGISFRYPAETYLEDHQFVNDSAQSWPPQVRILDGELVCKTGKLGTQNVSARVIDGINFCVITGKEAGMSHLWSSYVYAFNFTPDKVIEFSFMVYSTNGCAVYDNGVEPNVSYKKCLSEQALFTPAYLDSIVGKMAKSVKMF